VSYLAESMKEEEVGVPMEIVQILADAVNKVSDTPDHVKNMNNAGLEVEFMDTAKFTAEWAEYEQRLKPLIEEGLADVKQ
jgi:tripartite-type tricarboxylate transporter receptor subunit TctC